MQVAFQFILGALDTVTGINILVCIALMDVMCPHTHPTKAVATIRARNVHAPTILLNTGGTFWTRFGIGGDPIGRFRFALILFLPVPYDTTTGGRVWFLPASEAKGGPARPAIGRQRRFRRRNRDAVAPFPGTPAQFWIGCHVGL